jgi:hypothetical protein
LVSLPVWLTFNLSKIAPTSTPCAGDVCCMEGFAGGAVVEEGSCLLPGDGVLVGDDCWAKATLESTVANMNGINDLMSELLIFVSSGMGDVQCDCMGTQARRVPLKASL